MTDMIRRSFSGDIEIQSGGDGRTLRGIAVPFDQPTRIVDFWDEYDEQFARGAFAKTIAERGDKVKYLWQHSSAEPVGRAVALREDTAGLYGEWKISKTPRGDDLLELVRDGVIDANSIGFVPVTESTMVRSGTVPLVTRTEAKLREVSAVTFPAYEGAEISGVRSVSEDNLRRAVEFANELRAGNALSAENTAKLKHVLSLVAAADTAVDEAQPILAALLGVPNPDIAQDAHEKSDAPARGLSADLARRKARLLGVRF